ncbi:hypothetical protein KFL_007610050 [Klebsormidium nitens]|uniref:Uncharacterized protein n=1 Tax=Klebsormidium nitens TaxID=105231 RepID=A0A1Y1IME4_KLENI|nr:hypothetical protein KFL_007610050 [Klebsormidium nitens]|eukprot:GAQ91302.1 hypothetical protein KFL_007610050 [Klebsormidium nitens]
MAQPDLGVCLSAFCGDFRVFANSLEKSCKDLRRAVSEKSQAYVEDGHFASILEDLSAQVETVEEEVSSLEASTVETISVAELLGHCNELFLQNESAIKQLEAHLEQYGYTPVHLEPLEESNANQEQLAKPSPFPSLNNVHTPSWGSHQKIMPQQPSERWPSGSSGRPPVPSSNASTPAHGMGEQEARQEFASPSKVEETTLELRRDILGRGAKRPAPPRSPGSPEILSLADLGLSDSSLEAIRDDRGDDPPPPPPRINPSVSTSNNGANFREAVAVPHHEPRTLSSSFETPRPSASHPASRASATDDVPIVARPAEGDEKGERAVPGISVRQRDRKPFASSAAGDSLFPLAEPVTQAELDSVPFFLRAQVSLHDLNAAVEKINDSVTDKRFSEQEGEGAGPGADWLTQDDLAALNLGPRLKAYLLLLVRLDRITAKHVAGATAYALQAGPSKQ